MKPPTSLGSTGEMMPIDIMSSSTVTMMKGMAAWRPRDVLIGGSWPDNPGSKMPFGHHSMR